MKKTTMCALSMNTIVVRDYIGEMYEEMWRESKKEVTESLEYPQTLAQTSIPYYFLFLKLSYQSLTILLICCVF